MAGKIKTLQFAEGVEVVSPSDFDGVKVLDNEGYTITDTDGYHTIRMAGTMTGHQTIVLPSAANNAGRIINFFRTATYTSGYYYTISTTISGGTTNNIFLHPFANARVISDGTAWYWLQDIQESGTFTPEFSATTTAFTTVTYNATYQKGVYQRNGRMIQVSAYCTWTNTTGAATGRIRITGFPIAARNADNTSWSPLALFTSSVDLPTGVQYSIGRMVKGQAYAELFGINDNATTSSVDAAVNGGATSREVILSGVYPID